MLMSRREGIDLVCQVVLMYLRVKHFGRFIAVRWLAEKGRWWKPISSLDILV